MGMCSVFKHFRLIFKAGKDSQPTTEILMEKTYLIWKVEGGGGTKGLNQKNLPHVIFAFPGPLCVRDMWVHRCRIGTSGSFITIS
jgi:hypothetical protein